MIRWANIYNNIVWSSITTGTGKTKSPVTLIHHRSSRRSADSSDLDAPRFRCGVGATAQCRGELAISDVGPLAQSQVGICFLKCTDRILRCGFKSWFCGSFSCKHPVSLQSCVSSRPAHFPTTCHFRRWCCECEFARPETALTGVCIVA